MKEVKIPQTLITLIIGIILLAVYFLSFTELSGKCDSKIIYKYIPRTLEEEETLIKGNFGSITINFDSQEIFKLKSISFELLENTNYSEEGIIESLAVIDSHKVQNVEDDFGKGNSNVLFLECLQKEDIWLLNHQKQFRDLSN